MTLLTGSRRSRGDCLLYYNRRSIGSSDGERVRSLDDEEARLMGSTLIERYGYNRSTLVLKASRKLVLESAPKPRLSRVSLQH